MENKRVTINEIEKALYNELDFDFSINEKIVENIYEFEKQLWIPFRNGERVYYRGERINSPERPLIPTLFRSREKLIKEGEYFVNIDSDKLIELYKSKGSYLDFYNSSFGKASKYNLYDFCAFSQHYFDYSPFIDFTKSLWVSLSFATKGRETIPDDFVIYTLEISDDECCTSNPVTAECWLNDFKVTVFNNPEKIAMPRFGFASIKALREAIDSKILTSSPQAKLIDIPTNDLMKFQQGVFLMLTDYSLISKSYLTKNIRNDFKVTKYVINRDLASDIVKLIEKEAPWYTYDCLLDIKKGIRKASEK